MLHRSKQRKADLRNTRPALFCCSTSTYMQSAQSMIQFLMLNLLGRISQTARELTRSSQVASGPCFHFYSKFRPEHRYRGARKGRFRRFRNPTASSPNTPVRTAPGDGPRGSIPPDPQSSPCRDRAVRNCPDGLRYPLSACGVCPRPVAPKRACHWARVVMVRD